MDGDGLDSRGASSEICEILPPGRPTLRCTRTGIALFAYRNICGSLQIGWGRSGESQPLAPPTGSGTAPPEINPVFVLSNDLRGGGDGDRSK